MRTGWWVAQVIDGRGVRGDSLIVEHSRILWVGWHRDLGAGLDIAWHEHPTAVITPGFVDAHVHLTATGLAKTGIDLTSARCADDVLRAVVDGVRGEATDAVVFGHGWDDFAWPDSRLPTTAELNLAAGGRRVYLSRVDVHSALVSSDLLTSDAQFDPAGSAVVKKEHHGKARQMALAAISARQRTQLQQTALASMASAGITSVHENAGPVVSSLEDMRSAIACGNSAELPAVLAYWGALGEAGVAKTEGALGAGGDLFVDGSVGSRTAHVCQPYADDPSSGASYVSREEVAGHIRECIAEGVQAGFHVIGDAAMSDICRALDDVAHGGPLPVNSVRLEHAEMVSPENEMTLMRHGVSLSMQPMFDALWGGGEGMYAQRLGQARALRMNRFADHRSNGILVGFGSDSPVTEANPWQALVAAVHHSSPSQRLTAVDALSAHTVDAHALAGITGGLLDAGQPADFGVWEPEPGQVAAGNQLTPHSAVLDEIIAAVAQGDSPSLVTVYRGGHALSGAML